MKTIRYWKSNINYLKKPQRIMKKIKLDIDKSLSKIAINSF